MSTERVKEKREEMTKESWIKNVLRIHPEKTRAEAEELHDKIFGQSPIKENSPEDGVRKHE